jgi:putative solute:sodium symporter small subunit
MKLTAAHRAYWRRNLLLTLSLLVLWFGITFGGGYYAIALNRYYLFDFPLGFYLFAQGALILYLAIVGLYVMVMNRLDRRYGFDERRPPPRS